MSESPFHPTGRSFLALCFFSLCMLALSACQPAPRPETSHRPPPLILISIDGFRADYLELGLTPTLAEIAASGVRAQAMRPAFPSLTFPNHYTLVTGLVPDHHGVVGNSMVDPDTGDRFWLSNREAVEDARWWNGGQPLWNTARAAGLRSATMFWPGSEAPVRGHHPDYWRRFDATVTPVERVAQVLEWLDLPPARRPDFLTLYFDAVDHEGHVHGPDSEQAHAALRDTDAALAALQQGLAQRGLQDAVNLVVVSDHGMANTPPEQAIALDDHVPREAFDLINRGPLAGVQPMSGQEETLAQALAQPIDHIQCWPRTEVPARFQFGSHPRVPAWVCLADEGWTIHDHASLARMKINPGAHGFDPALDSMAALFVARGPDFRQGLRVAAFDNVDVYPLLARLLRIRPEPNDGDPVTTLPMLREGRDFTPIH